ncbi:MAG TPA: hydroxyacid dehydrogenase [Streptosporangiaceae bacterium]|nr:hydroxyacid dehydrogenase [Streptosporangiaceae bacterium]
MTDVLLVEDVWADTFDERFRGLTVRRSPGAGRADLVTDTRALIVRNRTAVDGDLLAAAPRLEVIGRFGVGLDNIDVAAADARGVVVVAPLGANATSVAEHTVALALALSRDLTRHDAAVRAGGWQRLPGRELAGRTWGLLGAGATGQAVGRLGAALRMPVIAHDPYLEVSGLDMVDFGTLLASADVLSVHVPLTAQTRGMLDAAAFARMRPGALLISVGRGEVVAEEALADALLAGRLGGAGLDVRAIEPPRPGPLDDAPNVIFTPHVAGITLESQARIAAILAEDIAAVLGGGIASHAVGAHRSAR